MHIIYIYLETQEPIKKKVIKNNQVFAGKTRFCPKQNSYTLLPPSDIYIYVYIYMYGHDAEADVFHHRPRDRPQVVASWTKNGNHISH